VIRPSIGLFLGRPDRSARLAAGLRASGWSVTHYNTSAVDGDVVVPVRREFPYALASVLRTDHDVYYTALTNVPSMCLYLNQRLRGRPYVFNATGIHWQGFADRARSRRFSRLFERSVHPFLLACAYRGASRIVCNSRFLETKIVERHPELRDRLLTIHNGIDFERFRRLPATRPSFAAAGDVVLACVTTLNYGNKSSGLGVVLDAFERVCAAEPRVKLVIAAKTAEPRYREIARERVARARFADSISLEFNVPTIPQLLAGADLFVYAAPEASDSLPRALLEAQAAGLPAVVTATNGSPEVVADGETGRLVPYDAAAMAVAIRELVADSGLRRSMAERAGERVRDLFSWQRMADAYGGVFEAVLDDAAAPLRAASLHGGTGAGR
jgi:glycosyltransferase involved in cell wall biosynthesis